MKFIFIVLLLSCLSLSLKAGETREFMNTEVQKLLKQMNLLGQYKVLPSDKNPAQLFHCEENFSFYHKNFMSLERKTPCSNESEFKELNIDRVTVYLNENQGMSYLLLFNSVIAENDFMSLNHLKLFDLKNQLKVYSSCDPYGTKIESEGLIRTVDFLQKKGCEIEGFSAESNWPEFRQQKVRRFVKIKKTDTVGVYRIIIGGHEVFTSKEYEKSVYRELESVVSDRPLEKVTVSWDVEYKVEKMVQ